MKNNPMVTSEEECSIHSFLCQVKNVTPLSANTFQIELASPENIILDYKAGHYLKLELDVDDDGTSHALFYSIANGLDPENPHRLQLLIHNGSEFADKILKRLAVHIENNSPINVTLPMGKAFLQTDLNVPHLLIAAGSGIAKIKCLAETIVRQRANANVTIYWSNKSPDDFYLLDEFQALVEQNKNLTFTTILEAASSNWQGRSGYIYEVVEQDFKNLNDTQAYICGSPQMVYGTIDQLKSRGLKEDNCYSDAFEFAPRQKE